MIPIEVGCRGFLGHSVISFLSKIGITGRSLKVASNRLQTAAQYALFPCCYNMHQVGFGPEQKVMNLHSCVIT